ncbi:hypothetical protein AAFG13_17965 [Bradyrhizobium sp. B124]|uniref:hypothetical protein n=1 Tax=Bradyrhizobium sp. B124 TaxID=3140245 RepID=UPI0031831F7F
MNFRTSAKVESSQRQLPFECVALVLQGGGALGQDLCSALHAWLHRVPGGLGVANIFGAINSAIIAGNPPKRGVDRLREFWMLIATETPLRWFGWAGLGGDKGRKFPNRVSANLALTIGATEFFLNQNVLAMATAVGHDRTRSPQLGVATPTLKTSGRRVVIPDHWLVADGLFARGSVAFQL